MEVKVGSYTVLVDKKWHEKFKHRKWSVRLAWGETPYVFVGSIGLARLILNTPKGMIADHKNHDTLDNRRRNIRNATRSQNMWNRKKTCGRSKYKGVSFARGLWRAEVYMHNKLIHRSAYKTEAEAAKAYNKIAKKHYGEFACLNRV